LLKRGGEADILKGVQGEGVDLKERKETLSGLLGAVEMTGETSTNEGVGRGKSKREKDGGMPRISYNRKVFKKCYQLENQRTVDDCEKKKIGKTGGYKNKKNTRGGKNGISQKPGVGWVEG